MDLYATLARALNLLPIRVEAAVVLLDAGNTIPFIARYRKEATGSLDEEELRRLAERLGYLRCRPHEPLADRLPARANWRPRRWTLGGTPPRGNLNRSSSSDAKVSRIAEVLRLSGSQPMALTEKVNRAKF